MVITHTGNGAGGELAQRRLHGNDACGQHLSQGETQQNAQEKAGISISSLKLLLLLYSLLSVSAAGVAGAVNAAHVSAVLGTCCCSQNLPKIHFTASTQVSNR